MNDVEAYVLLIAGTGTWRNGGAEPQSLGSIPNIPK
jgi:hypothetical protein